MIIDEGTHLTEVTVITVFDGDNVQWGTVIHEGHCNHTKSVDALLHIATLFTLNIDADDYDGIDPDINMLFEEVEVGLRMLGLSIDMSVHEITIYLEE